MRTALVRDMSVYLALAIILGTAANLVSRHHLAWWGQGMPPPREGVDFQWLDPVSADALRQALPNVVFVDGRTPATFELGHIPEAVRLPYTDLSRELTPDLARRLRNADAVIIYGDTIEADPEQLLAQELKRLGLPPPYIIIGGFEGWTMTGAETSEGGAT